MSINRYTGTPWHTETLKKDEYDDRRHRSRCVYYVKQTKHCRKHIGECRGSAHCEYYEELEETISRKEEKQLVEPKKLVKDNRYIYKAGFQNYKSSLRVGGKVRHVKLGKGTIYRIDNDKITIYFDDGTTKTISIKFCYENNLLVLPPEEKKKHLSIIQKEKMKNL